jgi:hypothetical protein
MQEGIGYKQEVIVLGSGTSGCVPNISCLFRSCTVCKSAVPGSRNRRRNTSVVVRCYDGFDNEPNPISGEDGLEEDMDIPVPQNILADAQKRIELQQRDADFISTGACVAEQQTRQPSSTILIDCGKTFYESMIEWFPVYGITHLDGVILTHGHADAVFGIDDLRGLSMPTGIGGVTACEIEENPCHDDIQESTGRRGDVLTMNGGKGNPTGQNRKVMQDTVHVYCDFPTFQVIERAFPYTVDKKQATGSGQVPTIKYHIIEPNKPFYIGNTKIIPFEGPFD